MKYRSKSAKFLNLVVLLFFFLSGCANNVEQKTIKATKKTVATSITGLSALEVNSPARFLNSNPVGVKNH